jgi:hypothetical protein
MLQAVARDPVRVRRAREGLDTHQGRDGNHYGGIEDLQTRGVGEDFADIGWAQVVERIPEERLAGVNRLHG